jgi:hypothetical protein
MKRGASITLWLAGTAAVMYAMIYGDVVMRAKEAYQEGEKYSQWADHPEIKARFLDERFTKEKAKLDGQLSKGALSKDDYDRSVELAQFDHDQALKESSIKYAYVWYQTAAELFSPPESQWVKLSREKMPVAKQRWESELRAKNIPFEDYMIN